MIRTVTEAGRMAGGALRECIFCQIATSSTSTTLLHSDDRVVAFRDINPSAFRHYLVIPKQHIPTVKNLQRRPEDFSLVTHMLDVGKSLLHRDAPQSKHYRFGFHQPPFNSVDHLHLHCFALPYTPSWRCIKYLSLGPLGGFIEVEKLLERIKPPIVHPSSIYAYQRPSIAYYNLKYFPLIFFLLLLTGLIAAALFVNQLQSK